MATEEEAREAADGEEVQVEAADLGTSHSQMNLDRKLSSHEEITDGAKIMDSTEGLLKVTEDQVSEKAPSAVEIPPEHTPNSTASSLNGDIKDEKISNEKPQENGQKDNEQVEASPDGISTDQSNRSNGEAAVDSLGHVESTTEDTSLLEHENEEPKEHNQQDAGGAAVEDKLVHEDTPQTDEPAVDAQQCQNLEPVEVTEDTQQHASTSCIPQDEVAAEAPAGVQTSLEPNVDDSRALPDATDGNTETKPAKVDKESCPDNEDIAEHPNEIVKLNDQPSKQTDDVDADLVQEEVPKSKKSDVPEDKTKTEQADESTNGDQEELNQESPEDINGPVHEKAEETSHKSNVSASEETTPEHDATSREPALDVQEEQNQGLAEEIADAKEVDTEETVQQSGVAFEEASPEDNVATIEPSSDIQHVNNVESEETKGLEDAKAEETSNQSNLTISEDAAQDKEATEDIQLVQGLEEEEPESTGTVETVEASNQPHAIVLNNLAKEDGVPACQPQVIELKEDVKDTGVTETQEITQQSHVAASEELVTEDNSMAVESQNDDIQQSLEQGSVEVKDTEAPETQEICHERTISASEGDSVEDDVAAEEPTCDAQEDENVESVEEIKDNTPGNIVETYNVATVEESDQENSVPASQDVSEQQTRGLEPEDIQNTEPVETEEASDQSNPALLNDPPQEDSIPSDMPKTESTAEVAETEATRTEALPQESNVSTCEEPASEENITVSEITCDAQEVESSEQAEEVQGNKDTETKEISDKSNEMATEDNTIILTDASIQQLQEQEQVEFRDSEATEPQGIPPSHIASTSEESTPEDNVTAEPSPDTQAENSESATVTEETKDVESTDAIAEDETPEEHIQEFEAPVHTPPVEEPELEETKNTDNQMDAAVLEDPTHEDNPTASESLVMESAAVSSREATEGQEMPQSEDTQPEDHKTEENTTASEPEIVEPEPAEEIRDSEATEPRSISQQSIVSSSEESVPEEDVTAKEQASNIKVVQTEELELIEENNDVEAGEISNQSRGTTVGETAQDNLESATVTEDTKDVESSDAIAEEEPPEDVQEFVAPVDIPPVEEPELKETKNTEPVEVHDNVTTDDQPAEEVDDTEATGIAEIHNESGDLTEDVKSNVALAEEAAPNEDAKATEATADIPEAQDPELAEIKNTEPVEVHDNVTTDDQPAEEVKESEATEIAEIHNESDLTEDVKSNVALADVAAPDEDAKATEAAADMPEAQEPELEEIKNSEPVEVEDNIIARELPEEEIKDTQAMETEMIPDESTSANISELTNYVKSNVALAEEEAPKEHVIAAEATTDIPRAQEPELEEIKDTEPVEVEENISASDQSAEEIKATEAMETEAVNESTDTKNSELTENVNRNFTPEDEAAHEDHVLADETTVHIPRAQEPELEEIKNTEPVEVKDDISASDLPAEEMKETEATETEVISESTDADIREPTEDAKRNVALADEAAPEEHVVATQAPVDIPRAQETELEEINNAEHVEVEENTSANNLPAEEVKDTETMETEATTDTTDTSITDLTEDAALADEAASDIHVDIPAAQEPTVEEVNNAEPVEAEDSITADDVLAEEINDTEAMGTEETPDESTDDSLTVSAPLADIQQAPEQEAVENKKCNDTTENQGEPTPTESTVSTAAEITPTDEETTETEPTQDTNVQNATAQETEGSEDVKIQEFSERSIFSTAEVPAQESPLLGGELASDVQQVLERDSAEEIRGSEAVQTEDDQQHGVSNVEKPVSENNVPESEAHVADQVQEEKSAEVKDTEAMGPEEISIQVPTTENAAQESSEPGSDPDLLLQSEDSKDQFVEAEETGESNDASLEEPTAEDNAANETNPLADTKEEQGLESVEGNKGIDNTEGEEASHPSQDASLEELVSESIVATIEPASDIQQVNDLDEAKETTATEAKEDEETSCKKTEVATLEDPSLTDNGTSPKQKDESSDLGEKTTFTTQEGGSPTVQNSGEDTVGISNNIKEQSKDVTELGAIQIEEHTNDQDNEQPHDVELPMQVCERSFDVSAIEQPDEDVQKVNLDQQQNEDEAIEKKTEEIQRDEQKHDDSSTDFTTETLLEPQSSEIGTPNLQEDTDVFEGEQTETVATEVFMNEQTQHIPQESIPNIADVEAEKSTETEEMSEHENTPNNTETLYSDAEDEKENIAKPSTDEQDGTINEEDESSDLGEKTAFTTPEGGSPTEEDVVQISGEDTVGISNNIEQIKEQSKDIIELDAIQSEDHTNDQDNEQPHDVELPMQVGERSFDVSAIEHPDEDVQKVNLDQQQNEDEAIEKKTEEIQRDEQKHDDSSTELTTETLLEPQSSEIGTPNLQEDTDVFEAEQTETVATEVLMNEQTQHIPQESIPNIADVEAEKSTETEEMSEHENALNNTETLYTDAEDEKENIAKPSTDEQDGTIDETINEEVGNGLASPMKKDLQNTSDPAPSNEEMLENTPTLVPQNVEPKVHGEEEECINNVNDDVQAIQASEEEIVDEVEKRQEMKNEDTDVNNDAIQTKPVDEEASVLHSNDITDTKVDDTMSPYAEMVHGKIDAQPAETEEVEQDLNIHPKVVHDNLATAEQNGAEVETNSNKEMATSYKAVTEAVKFNEAIENKASGAEGALSDENLETFEDNRRNLEASSAVTASGESMNKDKELDNLTLPAHSAVDGDTTEQGSALEVTERGLLFPEKPLPTESEEQEESQTTKQQDEEDVHEQETGDTEKEEKEAEQSDLPVSNFLMNLIMGKESTEPEGNSEFEAKNKQEESTKDDSCLITSQQEESLVPIPAEHKVDNKLVFEQGKHNLEGSEETHDFTLESDEELNSNTHDLETPVCQNNVQGEISSEQVPGGPGMMTEMETRDVKLGEKATNSVCQEHMEAGTKIEEGSLKSNLDESTNPKASQEDTLEEGRTDLQYESLTEGRSSDAAPGQTLLLTEPDMGAEKILPNDTDDLQSHLSTKREEPTESSIIEAESTIKEELVNEVEKDEDKEHTTNTGGATEGQIEKSHDNSQKRIEATSDEQTDKITEPAIGTEIKLVHEQDISAGSECQGEKQSYKLSNSELDNSEKALEIQSDGSSLHINQDKQDEFAGEQIVMENNLLDKPGESSLHEEQKTEIGQKSPKESDGGDQNCLATIEPLIKEENVNRTVESHMQTLNTKSNEEQETFKSQVQERDLDVVSAKEVPKTEENVVQMAKPEFSTDEEQCPKKDESNTSGENVDKTKDEKEAKSFTGEAAAKIEEQGAVQKVSQRDLSVVLPTEAPGSEESFVDIKNEEFSTDEEQSPTKDESSMAEDKSYDEKTNGDEEAKNFTDEAPTKIEEREAGQKASPKKHNILFGVGSKVKHQLAKVKKAIIGKPGHTKSELAKS